MNDPFYIILITLDNGEQFNEEAGVTELDDLLKEIEGDTQAASYRVYQDIKSWSREPSASGGQQSRND